MDMNHYMYQDQMMPSRPGDPNNDSTPQWSHDIDIGTDSTSTMMQWHHPYQLSLADYNLPHPVHHQLHQPMIPQAMQRGYHPMRSLRSNPPENSRAMAPYPRSAIPGSMGRPTYPSVGYSHGQPPALRQLHPSNEQLRNLPEMHPGMHHGLQFGAPPIHMGSLSMPMMSHGISVPPARPSKSSTGMTLNLPNSTSAILVPFGKTPAKRTNTENSTTPTESPKKKIGNLKNLPNKTITVTGRTEKSKVPSNSPEKKNKPKFQRPINRGVRFITASVPDVLRWKKNHVFSDTDRVNLLVEVVGTVFDIVGLQPVKISVHSQGIMNGIFWETDLRLDRNVVLPGCLVKVVLRIPPDGQDFHFLKVTPLQDPVAVNAYRRIAYITGSSIEQSKLQ